METAFKLVEAKSDDSDGGDIVTPSECLEIGISVAKNYSDATDQRLEMTIEQLAQICRDNGLELIDSEEPE